ncbi:MAG: DUF3881 family protein [Thermoflexaceae bacterium]|nr:DUF3881 family protein [Thermoflexaceae bacterium]
MHLYLKSIGFSGINSSSRENRFIRKIIKEAIASGQVKYNEDAGIGVIMAGFGRDFGICIKGSYNGRDKFSMEYYYPYLLSDCVSNIEELSIERHADKDSYAIVCDEVKAGVTLIFYLQNIFDYYNYKAKSESICGRSISLSGLSLSGKILLPLIKNDRQIQKIKKDALVRNNLIAAARNGDEEAMENLTIEDLDTYSQISRRVMREDIYSIVDSTFMPYGVECDQYSVIGEILDYSYETNTYTGEEVCIMVLDCNDIIIKTAINQKDLIGEPEVGRRFKGSMWISAQVNFD